MDEYITIHSEDLKYPSEKEFKKVLKKCPKLEIFNFAYNHALILIVNERKSLNEASRLSNLYWWDSCLQYRLEKVRDTYVYTLTNHSRGFFDDYTKCTHIQLINHFGFNYYAEIFYYFFFSTRDIIAQILNSFYSLGIKENQLHFNKAFINKIIDKNVKIILLKYEDDTIRASDYRNGFTHRFTPNLPDHRSVVIKDNKELKFGGGRFIESGKIVENIDNSINSLSNFILELKEFIKL
jgi:hypothetical protein